MITIPHLFYIKQGDTFILEGVSPIALAGMTLHAHIRTKDDILVSVLNVEVIDDSIKLIAASTASWTIGVLYMDLLLQSNSIIIHSQTISFECIASVTRL